MSIGGRRPGWAALELAIATLSRGEGVCSCQLMAAAATVGVLAGGGGAHALNSRACCLGVRAAVSPTPPPSPARRLPAPSYLLPPIIFNCGLSVERHRFFLNLPSILL